VHVALALLFVVTRQEMAALGGCSRGGLQIGHVDAGKSTLTGHLLHSLGLVTNKEMHKNRKEAAERYAPGPTRVPAVGPFA